MADLYEQPKSYVTSGEPMAMPTGSMHTGQPSVDQMLAQLSPEEREEAMQFITAPPTGEEISKLIQEKNANGEVHEINREQYRLLKSHLKTQESDLISLLGEAGSKVFEDIQAAAKSTYDNPAENLAKLTPSVIEAFFQGTRGLYGMAAQAQDPTSIGFRVKNAVLGNGDDEDAEIAQYMDAQKFTIDSIALASGKKTIVMDRDMINHEMTQLMTYVADPTLFIPFGGLGVKAASIVGMGEKLAMASARAAAIKRGIIGGTLKWGVGAPIEFLGNATRNTIEFGLEKGSQVLETATGVSTAEAKTVARLSQWGTAAASMSGASIDPLLSGASKISLGAGTAAGLGEAVGMVGEQMLKQRELGRGILSYAGQALKDTEKSGIVLSKQARGLLNIIDAADPLFAYADEITSGMAQGAVIGGALGYYAGNEEGMASGIGTGIALGGIGAGAGKVFRDVSGQTLYDRAAVQRKMVVEGLKELGHVNAVSFEAMADMAERTGDRKFQAQIDGFIAGWDKIAPDTVFKAFNEAGYGEHLNNLGLDPDTGVLREKSRIFPEVGDRGVRASVLGILRDVGGSFAGNSKGLEQAIKVEPRYQKLKNVWDKLDNVAKDTILKQIDQNGNADFIKGLKGRKLNEHFSDLAFSESSTNMITDLYKKNSALVPDKIREIIKAQTRSDKKLTRRGQMLKEKLQADGYIDKEGNVRTKRLVDIEGTMGEFEGSAGWVKRRDSSGRTEVYINLDKWAKDSGDRQSLPHELYHAVMRDSVLMRDYQDRLIQKLLGKFDPQTGKRIESASIPLDQVKQFMYRYLDAQYKNETPEFISRKKKELDASVEAFRTRDTQNRVDGQTETPLEHLVEEFGAYYFARWLGDKPVDFLFRGGELGGIRGLLDSAKDGWLEFWKGKMKEKNPSFDFSNPSKAITKGFESNGKRVKVTALDLFMRDLVRMESNRNKTGAFNISNLSQEAQAQFIKSNGLRGQGFVSGDRVKRPSVRKYTAEETRQGKEMFKILETLSDADHKGGMRKDGDGNWSGKPNTAQVNALVGAGFIERAWFERMGQAYSIVEGNGSNTIEFGYLGYSAHTGDGAERVYGAAVPFKSRKAILLSVETKVRADGTVYSNFHTLDARVIEARGNEIWKDPQVRDLWNGDRTQMEADFYAYLSNASLPSGNENRKPSAMLLERKDGLGGQRRDALHQMLGFHKGTDLPYINRPLAEIPIGIRHSVTTFSNDGIVNMRVENKQRVNYDHQNAHLDLSRNFMPSEMESEKTPAGGRVIRHATGYRILEGTDKKFRVVSPEGKDLGKFDKIADAGRAAQKHFNATHEAKTNGIDTDVPRTEVPPSRQKFIDTKLNLENNKEFLDAIKTELTKKLQGFDTRFAVKVDAAWHIENALRELEQNGLSKNFLAVYKGIEFEYKGKYKMLVEHISNEKLRIGNEYDNMYPMEIKSALHGQLAQIFQDYPTITAQGLLKKLVTYGSRGSRFFQEASEIGLVDLLKSKTRPKTEINRVFDLQKQEFTGEVRSIERQVPSQIPFTPSEIQEIMDFAKSKEIKVTIEEGAREVNGMDTEQFTFAGDKSNYKQTAVRINPEYAHGIRGHYGKDTIVHFRTTERLDSEGNRVLFIEEVQANNPQSSKRAYITPEQARVSREIVGILKTYDFGTKLGEIERDIVSAEQSLHFSPLHDKTLDVKVPKSGFLRKEMVKKLNDQKDMFNLILKNYIEILRNNSTEYIKEIKETTGASGVYSEKEAKYQSKKAIRQGWLNELEMYESSALIRELEKHIITDSTPEGILDILKSVRDEQDLTEKLDYSRRKVSEIPTIEHSIKFNVYKTLNKIRNSASYGYSAGVQILTDGFDPNDKTFSGSKQWFESLPYIHTSIGSSQFWTHTEYAPYFDSFVSQYKDLVAKNPDAQKAIKLRQEEKALASRATQIINMAGDLSHLRYRGESKFNYDLDANAIKELGSLAQTNLDKFSKQGDEKIFPMTETKDWTLTALKGIIRQGIRDGLDKITLTHPDDSPTVSNMKESARKGLYGKIIPEVWASWLKKYGIEIKQENKLFEATVDKAKQDMAKVANQVYESNKAVLDRFQQVGQGEKPDVINKMSQLLSTPVHEFTPEMSSIANDVSGSILDQKLKERIERTIHLKDLEHSHFTRVNEARADAGAAGLSRKDPSVAWDSQISAEIIDRGMTFELNDRIKREFLEGRISTHAMPSESTARTGEPIPMGRYRMPMSGNVLLKVSPQLINDEIFKTNKGQSLRVAGNEKTRDGVTGTDRIKKQYQNNFWKNPEASVDAAVLKFGDEKYIKGLGLERELGIDNGRHRLKAAEELGHAYIAIEVPKSQERMFDRFLVKDGTPPDGNGSRRMMPSEGEQGGRTYKDFQLEGRFIGKYAQENPNTINGLTVEYFSNDTSDFKDVTDTKWRVALRDKSGNDIGDIAFEYEERGGFFNGTEDVDGLVVSNISVNIRPEHRGKNYQHLLYSEMFERARATGAIGFSQNIENKGGLPLKSVNKIVGKDGSKIWTLRDYDPVDATQENFDRLMSNAPKMRSGKGLSAEFVQNNGRLDFNARYQPAEGEQGGRVYTDKQISSEFIGRIASESPELKKGLKLYYGKVPQGMGAVGVTLRNKKGDVVANIKAIINRDAPNYANIEYSEVTKGQQGKGFGKLVYSELIERLRSFGVEEVSGTVIDTKGRPQAIRRTVIDKINEEFWRDFSKENRFRKTRESESEDISEGTEVVSQLHKKAYYQPAEYTEFKTEQSAAGRIMRNAKGYVIMMSGQKFRVYNPAKAIIGVYGNEEEAKKRIYKEIPKQ